MAVSRRVLLAMSCGVAVPVAVAVAVAVESGRAWAEAASPAAPILALNAALIAVMKAGDSTPFAKRYQMLAPAIDRGFDLPRILSVSVGSYWTSLPAAQQQKLQEVFRSFIIANYVANFHGYAGEVAAVAPATRAVGAQQVVTSTITKPSGDALRIDYVMGQTAGGWEVQDILLDGTISRVAVQRSDFGALLSQGDATPLIASLERKVSRLSDGSINA
jgi:phospholipid transport system substrate-binding protein